LSAAFAPPQTIIQAGNDTRHYWREVWRYRELLLFLSWRLLLIRYKQTVLGLAWALSRPLLTLAIVTLVFSRFAGLPSDGVPYALLVIAGLLPWQFFAGTLAESSGILVDNANLLTKVYFPRLLLPASAWLVCLADFAVAALLLVGLMCWHGHAPTWRLAALPLFLLLLFGAAGGAGLWVAALNVRYRDFRHLVPFVVQFGLYLSPVGFSASLVPERWRWLYALNPLVGIIDGFRWCLLDTGVPLHLPGVLLSAVCVILLAWSGLRYFRQTEHALADII
jgi:lipopolysaccharide transport system permease protein